MSDPSAPRPSATIVLLRPRRSAGFRVLLLRRSARSSFMPDTWVFPGGAVEARDRELAAQCGATDVEDATHRIAAIRETIEEAGLIVGATPVGGASRPPTPEERRALSNGSDSLPDLLTRCGFGLSVDRLAWFANWITPTAESKRFDTRFYAACVPVEDRHADADGAEMVDGAWMTPAEAVAASRAREIMLPPPTFATLLRFAAFEDAEAAWASCRPPREAWCPELATSDDLPTILLPADPLEPDPDRAAGRPCRIVLRDGAWHFAGR